MMNNMNGHFETLQHHTEHGIARVPLYFDGQENLTPESTALLRASEIISTRIEPEDMRGLLEDVGTLLTGEYTETDGLVVEDPENADSLTIGRELTTVRIGRGYKAEVATNLLFDMLYAWQESQEAVSDDHSMHDKVGDGS